MSHKATAWAFAQNLPALQKLVLIVLADRHNGDTGRCDPSIGRMARDCGMSKWAIRNALDALQEKGLVVSNARFTGNVQSTNSYALKFDVESPTGGGAADRPPQSARQTGGGAADRPKPVIQPVKEPTTPPPPATGGRSATPDRHKAVRDAVLDHQRSALNGVTVWTPAADKALTALLRDFQESDWPAHSLVECVKNRFASDVDAADMPQAWLERLPTYVAGPKDRYKQPKNPRKQAKVVPIQGKFATAAVCLIQSDGAGREIHEEVTAQVKQHIGKSMSRKEFDLWVSPLILGFLKSDGSVVILAPSTEWEGMQQRFQEKICDALRENGLTKGFELWYMSDTGVWVKPVQSQTA